MRIAVATTGRFHLLDLARELAAVGHDVRFYSYVPRGRAKRYGLPASSQVSLLAFVFPLVAVARLLSGPIGALANRWLAVVMDLLVALRLEHCDVFICSSSTFVRAAQRAKEKYQALIYVERGSHHTLSQKKILDDLRASGVGVQTVPHFYVARELQMYARADRIAIPSRHVERSFQEHGVESAKLYRNCYGVDLTHFSPTSAPESGIPTAIFVGGWTYRKGADVLSDVFAKLSHVRLLHVGGLGDAPLPSLPNFEHHDPVEQNTLRDYYARAHVFVLASREEGLAMVLAQALACGLPVVCTDRTGGEDLQELLVDPSMMRVVPAGSADLLEQAILALLPSAMAMNGRRDLLGDRRATLSWSAYGSRYDQELRSAISNRKIE